jgi:hypothetical protein
MPTAFTVSDGTLEISAPFATIVFNRTIHGLYETVTEIDLTDRLLRFPNGKVLFADDTIANTKTVTLDTMLDQSVTAVVSYNITDFQSNDNTGITYREPNTLEFDNTNLVVTGDQTILLFGNSNVIFLNGSKFYVRETGHLQFGCIEHDVTFYGCNITMDDTSIYPKDSYKTVLTAPADQFGYLSINGTRIQLSTSARSDFDFHEDSKVDMYNVSIISSRASYHHLNTDNLMLVNVIYENATVEFMKRPTQMVNFKTVNTDHGISFYGTGEKGDTSRTIRTFSSQRYDKFIKRNSGDVLLTLVDSVIPDGNAIVIGSSPVLFSYSHTHRLMTTGLSPIQSATVQFVTRLTKVSSIQENVITIPTSFALILGVGDTICITSNMSDWWKTRTSMYQITGMGDINGSTGTTVTVDGPVNEDEFSNSQAQYLSLVQERVSDNSGQLDEILLPIAWYPLNVLDLRYSMGVAAIIELHDGGIHRLLIDARPGTNSTIVVEPSSFGDINIVKTALLEVLDEYNGNNTSQVQDAVTAALVDYKVPVADDQPLMVQIAVNAAMVDYKVPVADDQPLMVQTAVNAAMVDYRVPIADDQPMMVQTAVNAAMVDYKVPIADDQPLMVQTAVNAAMVDYKVPVADDQPLMVQTAVNVAMVDYKVPVADDQPLMVQTAVNAAMVDYKVPVADDQPLMVQTAVNVAMVDYKVPVADDQPLMVQTAVNAAMVDYKVPVADDQPLMVQTAVNAAMVDYKVPVADDQPLLVQTAVNAAMVDYKVPVADDQPLMVQTAVNAAMVDYKVPVADDQPLMVQTAVNAALVDYNTCTGGDHTTGIYAAATAALVDYKALTVNDLSMSMTDLERLIRDVLTEGGITVDPYNDFNGDDLRETEWKIDLNFPGIIPAFSSVFTVDVDTLSFIPNSKFSTYQSVRSYVYNLFDQYYTWSTLTEMDRMVLLRLQIITNDQMSVFESDMLNMAATEWNRFVNVNTL